MKKVWSVSKVQETGDRGATGEKGEKGDMWVALNTAECAAGHWLTSLVVKSVFIGTTITGGVLMLSM